MLKKLMDFAVSGVVVKWSGEAISQRVIPGSSPMSRESDDLFRKKSSFPIIPIKLAVP